MTLGLELSPSLARALTRKRAKPADRVASDALEVLAAYVTRRLDSSGARASTVIGPVHAGALPGGGLAFEVVTDFGGGTLVIDLQ